MVREKIVITGTGAVTPLGSSAATFWDCLIAGQSGIGPMTLCDPTDFTCQIAGEVPEFDPVQYMDSKEARRMARFSQLAVAAAAQAIEQAGLKIIQGYDNTKRFVIALETELKHLISIKEEFLQNFTQHDYEDLIQGWEKKIARAQQGSQKWGYFYAKKN